MHSDRISRCLFQLGRAIAVGVILLAATTVFAEGERRTTHGTWTERNPVESSSLRKVANLADDRATSALRKRFPELNIGETIPTPVDGIVVVKAGGEYLYLTKDGRYAFIGSLLDLKSGVNLTEEAKGRDRQAALAEFPDADRVVFPAKGQEKARLTVFTDTSCGFCRKLHREVPELQKAGITVTYIPFPRSGPAGPAYETMRKVWCSSDRRKAMDIAKGVASGDLGDADCKEADAVRAGYELGIKLGVRGTPGIVMPDGRLQPGYLSAQRLIAALGLKKPQS